MTYILGCFDTEQFKGFMCWEEDRPRRLWISGQAGTGKTILSIGTIKELQTQCLREPEPPTILYFFCQHTDADLNNGVAVLQSLVWMLLRQQPHLSSHLDEQFSHSGQESSVIAINSLRGVIFDKYADRFSSCHYCRRRS